MPSVAAFSQDPSLPPSHKPSVARSVAHSWTTTVYATAVIIVSSLSLFRIRTYARPKSKMLARSCGYEEESPVEPPKDKNETAE
jgi:hypothetical protein